MISKQEFIDLYCSELVYKITGEIGIDVDKLHDRLTVDRAKTIKDLEDYGLGDMMGASGLEQISALNLRNGKQQSIDIEEFSDIMDFLSRLSDELESPRNSHQNAMIDDLANFDWGSENSIE